MAGEKVISIDIQDFIECLPGIAFVKDRESRYLMVNRQYLEFRGHVSSDEIIGKTDFDLYPVSKAEKILAEDRQVLETGKMFSVEHLNTASNRTFMIMKVPLRDQTGAIIGLMGLSFDITGVKNTAAKLEESERLYRLLAENVRDTIWTRDLTMKYTYVSPSVTRMKGWKVDEALNLPMERVLTQESMAKAMEILAAEIAQDGEPGVDPARMATFIAEEICKDGSTIWTESTLSFIRDEEGRPRELLGVTRDITERKTLESQLSMSQKMEAAGRLAGGVAHEFNNILSVILSYSDFVKEGLPADSPLHADADEIIRAGRRATDVTRQLLAFSRRNIIQPEEIDPARSIRQMEKLLRKTLGESIKLSVTVEDGVPGVKIDPGQFDQIVFNLALNGLDAMPKGGSLAISVSPFDLGVEDPRNHPGLRPGRYLFIKVTDSGGGLPKDFINHLFEPFYPAKNEERVFGLGLSAIFGIVKTAGGEIFVSSEEGKGSEFSVFLPSSTASKIAPEGKKLFEPPREVILLAEDDDLARNIAERILCQKGYRVLPARDGAEAVSAARSHAGTIHLLITDILMPGMSGVALASVLTAARPGIKVLFMSGHAEKILLEQGMPPDAPLLKKPFDKHALLEKVKLVLEQ